MHITIVVVVGGIAGAPYTAVPEYALPVPRASILIVDVDIGVPRRLAALGNPALPLVARLAAAGFSARDVRLGPLTARGAGIGAHGAHLEYVAPSAPDITDEGLVQPGLRAFISP